MIAPIIAFESSHSARYRDGCCWLALAAILLLATALRWPNFFESFWLDELHTAWAIGDQLRDVAPRAMQGNQPPLPYWLLWGWVQVVGVSEWSLRGPALVASLSAIVSVAWVLWRWTPSRGAVLVAALALALEPLAIFHGGEARVYAWLELLAIWQVYWLQRTCEQPTRSSRWMLVLLSLGLVHLHYTAALLLIAEALFLVGGKLFNRSLAYSCRSAAIDGLLVLLGLLPLLPGLAVVAARRANWSLFIEQPSLSDLWSELPLNLVLLTTAALLLVVVIWRWRKEQSPLLSWPATGTIGITLTALGGPLLLAWTLTELDVARLFFARYLVVTIPAAALLLGLLIAAAPTARWRWVALLLSSVVLLSSSHVLGDRLFFHEQPAGRSEDWRGVVAAINRPEWNHMPAIVLAPGLIEGDALRSSDNRELVEFCSYPLRAAYRLDRDLPILPLPATDPGELTPGERRFATEHGTAWLVIRGDANYRDGLVAGLRNSLGPALRVRDLTSEIVEKPPARLPATPPGVHLLLIEYNPAGKAFK
ncbi:MAG TPA: glycosyltransferase family 39 protein [Pirellulaceae bacterium]|nr:glycosyltransferase family 39 protein [Pirellulaceae bacterium]